jgi:tetratricopeptide (TPR) repeat protein
MWGDDFDRPAGDVLAVQREIAQEILSEGIHLALSDEERRRLFRGPTDDPEAYELFLEAVHHLRMSTEDDYLAARALLARAVERAPRFALALVTLASTYSVMTIDGYEPPAAAWPESERHVARALAIDPGLADAHAEAAVAALFYRWEWTEAERHWANALRLRSEVQSELLTAYALQKWASGQPQAALELARAARQVDPLSPQASIREADLLGALGRLPEAAGAYERVIREQPEDPRAHFGLAEVRRKQGRFDEAIAVRCHAHALAGGDGSLDPLFARACGAAGYDEIVRAAARQELERQEVREETGGYVSPLDRARALAQLGDAAGAFSSLAAALAERSPGLVLLKVDPAWDKVRGDPRFGAAVARVGIP